MLHCSLDMAWWVSVVFLSGSLLHDSDLLILLILYNTCEVETWDISNVARACQLHMSICV